LSVIYLLLPLGLLMTAAAVAAFVWAVRGGQLDDLDTPAVRALFDDERLADRAGGDEAADDHTP
jgi:cbb3-type cytochrome oxidase maturation protein